MRRGDWLLGQLPMGMLDDEFFVRFVSMFQEVATSLLEGADNIPNTVDATVAPPAALPWLGSWLGVSWIDSSLPVDLQRHLVREAGQALVWRGTRRGLETILRAVTGGEVAVQESGGVRRAGDGSAPASAVRIEVGSTGWLTDEAFVELVADELPADVRLELVVGGRTLWPPAPGSPPGVERLVGQAPGGVGPAGLGPGGEGPTRQGPGGRPTGGGDGQ